MFELSQNPEIIGLLKPTSITIEKNSREFFKRFETFFTKKRFVCERCVCERERMSVCVRGRD